MEITQMKEMLDLKKYLLGLVCGLLLATTSVAFARESIKAVLFPASIEINGAAAAPGGEMPLNVEGRTYVPLRFIGEQLGAVVGYDADTATIFVKNGELSLSDPDYAGITAGNLILTKSGSGTAVTGQLQMAGVGNSANAVAATLTFYDERNRSIGKAEISGKGFGVEAHTFTASGKGDFRKYDMVLLHVDAVNGKAVPQAKTITYENEEYGFTLQLPEYWSGKYRVQTAANGESGIKNIHFTAQSGGIVFSLAVWPQKAWEDQGATVRENVRAWEAGRKGDRVFVVIMPGDVQYDPGQPDEAAEYQKLASYVDVIRTSFTFQ